jgi:phosphoribosyl 1,2-cyclic phosphodiesterase
VAGRTALASLGSGSRGNGSIVAMGDVVLLVDCGFPVKETIRRLARLGLTPADLTAVLVTHEHGDHSRGVQPLCKRFGLPVFLSHGTRAALSKWRDVDVRPFNSHDELTIGSVGVCPVPVPHDAREPTQFVFESAGNRVGVLTDIGHITSHVVERYRGCRALLVESNHDPEMLRTGPYPGPLKRRIAGPLGHLANAQAAAFLEAVAHDDLGQVVVGHISEQNNSSEHLHVAFARVRSKLPAITFATQNGGAHWHDVGAASDRERLAHGQPVLG